MGTIVNKQRLLTLLLTAVTGAASYVVVVVGNFVPRFLQVAYRLKLEELADFMSPVTRFGTGYSWVFVITLVLALAISLVLLRVHPEQAVRVMVATLCSQALVVWIAFFCYFSNAFYGPMSVAGPDFEVEQFLRFEAGVFPITLLLILTPLVGCFVGWSQTSARAESSAPLITHPSTQRGDSEAAKRSAPGN